MKKITGKAVGFIEPGKQSQIVGQEKMHQMIRSGYIEKLGQQLFFLARVDEREDWNNFISYYIDAYINDSNESVKETKASLKVDKNKFYSYLFNQIMKNVTKKDG